ncbi:MAG: hypothetical protein Q4G43_13500, partial [Mobilicoccus sp.]|nr:hypothetical protein [Mobilicoccus sp.]
MRGSWRLALRLARRDIAAHRVRSGLIVAMIGLPVFVIVAAITLFATSTLDTDEALPGTLGAAQARVVVQDVPLEQNADGTSIARRCGDGSVEGYMPTELWSFPISGDDTCRVAATPTSLPGVRDTTSLAEVTAGLERRTGANATPIRDTQLALVRDDLTTYFPVLEVDGRDPATAGMLTLTSGRWPTHRDEVLITRRAIAQGFPESGTVQPAPLEPGTRPAAVTVVGTVDIAPRRYVALSLVRLPEDTAVGTAYLLQRDTPFLWDEVRSLNADGVAVASRALVEDPGAAAVVDLGLGVPQTSPDGTAAIVTVATVGLLFAGCLVAGPAFVVIAARRRRDMALLAATGARVTDLRGVLLAQGLLLGALAAVVGAVLGVAVAVGGVVVTGRWWPLLILWGPIDVPVSPILLIALAAVAAALISAALPARGLATLDLRAAVDADAAPSPAPHPTRALLGVLLVAAGAGFFICFLALDTGVGGVLHDPSADPDVAFWLRSFIVTAGALCVVSGALLLVPAALQRLSAAAATWPPVPRLAMRDIARSHRRAV